LFSREILAGVNLREGQPEVVSLVNAQPDIVPCWWAVTQTSGLT
jgi:hypothetical protein